ncbi:metallophosphoesterase [Candidatus Woesearchaeota archaeon]|nr:metallophosphoesterase [Candidatus Woesearchaeota archaeon]
MVKILATGDWHGDVSRPMTLSELAAREGVDMVVLGGDLVNAHKDTTNLIGPFLEKGVPVSFVWGNHDGPEVADFWQQFYKITNLHGYGLVIGDVGFFGCGGANVGLDQFSEDEIFAYLRAGFDKIKHAKRKVMVTHVHPAGSLGEKFSRYVHGSQGVRKALDLLQPDVHLCCHVHEAEGIEETIGKTRVMNVGRHGKIVTI